VLNIHVKHHQDLHFISSHVPKEMSTSWTKATILGAKSGIHFQWNAFVPDAARRDYGRVIGSE
jgi:hypothetical protein